MKNIFAIMALALSTLSLVAENKPVTPPGNGTKDSPYLISKLEHLVWMEKNVANSKQKYYKLTRDLDASETKNWNNGKGFIPIGMAMPRNEKQREKDNKYPPFLGHFDGGGHYISNLFIRVPEGDQASFFGNIGTTFASASYQEVPFTEETVKKIIGWKYSYSVENLLLLDVDINAGVNASGLAGCIENTRVSGCYVSGKMTANKGIGGLVTSAVNCYFSECATKVNYENHYCGAAGLASHSSKTLFQNCFCSGRFRIPEAVYDPTHKGEKKTATGYSFEGIQNYYSGIISLGCGLFENCYSDMKLQGGRRIKEIKPLPEKEFCRSCYASADNFGVSKEPDNGIVANEKLRKEETFEGWDFRKIWDMRSGKNPSLRKLDNWL